MYFYFSIWFLIFVWSLIKRWKNHIYWWHVQTLSPSRSQTYPSMKEKERYRPTDISNNMQNICLRIILKQLCCVRRFLKYYVYTRLVISGSLHETTFSIWGNSLFCVWNLQMQTDKVQYNKHLLVYFGWFPSTSLKENKSWKQYINIMVCL